MRYSFIKKYVLTVIRGLKKYKHLVSNNKIQFLVSHVGVKDFILSKDLNEKHARWIICVMEYDVEIKVTKLVRGKGLCEQLSLSQQDEVINEKEVFFLQNSQEKENDDVPIPYWTQDIMYFLQKGLCPHEMSKEKRRHFRLQSIPYVLIDGVLFKRDINGILLRCIGTYQIERVLQEFHVGVAGGHFSP